MKLLTGMYNSVNHQEFSKFFIQLKIIWYISACLVIGFLTCSSQASIGGYITTSDKKKFLETLAQTFKLQGDDISSIYYGAKGYKLLGEAYAKTTVTQICDKVKKDFKLSDNLEAAFNVFNTWSLLGCSEKLQTDAIIKVRENFVNLVCLFFLIYCV